MKKQQAIYLIAMHESCLRLNSAARWHGVTSPQFQRELPINQRLGERAAMTPEEKIEAERILAQHGYNGTARSVTPAYRSYWNSVQH